MALKRQARLDCVYLYVAGQLWTPVAVVLVGLLRWLRVPIVIELNELPWTLRALQTLLQRLSHPLAGMTGVVAIQRIFQNGRGARRGDEARSSM